jgi:parvulin-like peptidyl-prolyl isomerase
VAKVNGVVITRGELDAAVDRDQWHRGQAAGQLAPEALRVARYAALERLIEDRLVAMMAKVMNPVPEPVEAYAAAQRRFVRQFTHEDDYAQRLRDRSISAAEQRERLEDHTFQSAWIEAKIAGAIEVSEADARAWFEAHPEGRSLPEAMRARHIFLTTHDPALPDREAEIRALHQRLVSGETSFAALAGEASEDAANKDRGGDLGWFTRARMPSDFIDQVWPLAVGATSEPFRTRLGWHIVQVTDRRPTRPAEFALLKPEILAHLQTERRQRAIELLVQDLKQNANIEIYPQNLAE